LLVVIVIVGRFVVPSDEKFMVAKVLAGERKIINIKKQKIH